MRVPLNFTHNNTVADNEPDWGSVDKTALPRAAFADQGEEGKKSSWRYPHHWVQNGGDKDENGVYTSGTMYLHRGGLNAAWAGAQGGRSGEEAPQSVKNHLQAHRRALGIEDMSSRRYEVRSQADEGEIWIWEEIGEGWFGGISAKQFAKDVKDLGDVNRIHLHINSPGGNVFDAVAMYNLLGQHKARVIVNIESLAASAASIVVMAGDEIYMADNAMMMIHEAWGIAIGNAEEMRKTAELLEKIDGTIVATYAKRTKLDHQVIKDLMSAETWMTASEALGYGFIDQVTDAMEAAATCDLARFNYRKVPKQFSEKAPGCRARLAAMSLKAQRIRIASNPKR